MSKLPDYDDALREALKSASPLSGSEIIALADAGGRVLREAVVADRDLPPLNRAAMDGYALRATEVGQIDAWPVAGNVAAGESADVGVPPGQCITIATGAPVPADVDAVIQHELSDRKNPVRFTIDSVAPGNNIHPRGADARAGDRLIEPPVVIGPQHLGIAASVGAAHLSVARRPRATVLSSGDEVMAIDAAVKPHQIRNSNGPLVSAALGRFGAEVAAHHHVRDDRQAMIDAVGEAIEHSDLLITVGAISTGKRDYFPDAFESHGATYSLRGAAIQPGKPIIVGRFPNGAVIVGLPGNPVSALACSHLFVWPIVRLMLGLESDLPWREVELAAPVRPNAKRRAMRPAMLQADGRASVPQWAGSGDLAHTARTDGMVELPVQEDDVKAGSRLRFLHWA